MNYPLYFRAFMHSFVYKHHRLIFYSAWIILALAQATSTELLADEAYYWVYSRFPDFGYFDHPPMIAILIRSGYSLLNNELGVRLLCVIMSLLTVMLTESLIERKNPFLFYVIVLSIGVLQIAGFLAVPDTPLLFFTVVYFYCFRYFLKKNNFKSALLLAISIALLFYTKYHGLLIVLFSVLSNLKLLFRKQLWIAFVLVIILYAPHLLWQWEHDWISFRYHLFESNVSKYQFSYTTDYLLGQLLLSGPLAGLILLPAAFLYKTQNETERALRFTMIGVYVLFFISSFRGKVEANWPMPALIPMIILSHQYLLDKSRLIKPLRLIAFVSLLLIMAGRIYLVVDIGPDNSTKGRFHNNDTWAKAIAEKTDDKPVVFYNSYQRASLFWFYSGKPSHSHNAYWDRRNNYDFWPTEARLLGQPVYIADIYKANRFSDSVITKKAVVGLRFDTTYSALGEINIVPEKKSFVADAGQTVSIKCTRTISRLYWSYLLENKTLPTELLVGIFSGKNLIKEIQTGMTAQQIANTTDPFNIILDVNNIVVGKYDLRFGIKSKDYPVTHNSGKYDLVIK